MAVPDRSCLGWGDHASGQPSISAPRPWMVPRQKGTVDVMKHRRQSMSLGLPYGRPEPPPFVSKMVGGGCRAGLTTGHLRIWIDMDVGPEGMMKYASTWGCVGNLWHWLGRLLDGRLLDVEVFLFVILLLRVDPYTSQFQLCLPPTTLPWIYHWFTIQPSSFMQWNRGLMELSGCH